MSINDYVETPMLGTFTLEDLTTVDPINAEGVLGNNKPGAPDAVIQTDMETPGPHDTTLSQSEIDEIPSWDVKIRILKENADKVVDMRDVQKDIEGVGRMDQSRSDVIEATFESFYSDRNSRKTYTTFESLTNLSFARAFMDKKIKTSLEALLTQFEEVNTNLPSEMAEDLLKARDFCIYELRDTINECVTNVSAVAERLCEGPIVLPFENDQFIDMTCANLVEVDITKLKQGVPVTEEFVKAYGCMVDLWKNDSMLRQFMEGLLYAYKDVCPEAVIPSVYDGLFLGTIVAAFGNFASEKMYDQYVTKADERGEQLNAAQKDLIDSVKAGSENVDSIISVKAGELSKLATAAVEEKGAARQLGQFMKVASTVAVGLSALR